MNDKILSFFTIVLFAGGLGTFGWVAFKTYGFKKELQDVGETACVSERIERVMNDPFMKGTLEPQTPYQVLIGYYKCNPVQREDLVSLRISPPMEPVVKKIRGLPGDRFAIRESEPAKTFQIEVNGKILEAGGVVFEFTAAKTPPLKTFEIARNGVLGANEFIVLSELPPGESDSTTAGVVKLSAFEGKVLVHP